MTDFERQTYLKYACENFINDKKMAEAVIAALISGAAVVGVHNLDADIIIESAVNILGIAGTIPLCLKTAINLAIAHFKLANTARPENEGLYHECLDMYNEYIYRLASLLSEVPVKDSLHLAVFLDRCMSTGFFSSTGFANYQKFSGDLDGRYTDLFGTRVLLGESVCRHNTVFATDVLKAMGYNAFYVSVDSLKKHSRYSFDRISSDSNHAVTGIVDKDGRYIYDFTWGKVAYFDKNVSNELGVNPDINIYLSEVLKNYYSGIEYNTKGYVLARNWFQDDLSMFMNAEDKEIDLINVNEYVYLTDRLFKEYFLKLVEFRESNKKLTDDIVGLSKVLIPYSKPIK